MATQLIFYFLLFQVIHHILYQLRIYKALRFREVLQRKSEDRDDNLRVQDLISMIPE